MKTKFNNIPDSDLERMAVIDPPYTVFGHTSLSPSFSLSMRVGGLRKMIKALKDDDSLSVILSHNSAPEYQIIRKKSKNHATE